MEIPNNFCSLLIRGTDLTNEELEHIKNIYNRLGRTNIYNFVKNKKIIPFAANTFVNYDMDKDFWHALLDDYRKRNSSIIVFLNKVYKIGRASCRERVFSTV